MSKDWGFLAAYMWLLFINEVECRECPVCHPLFSRTLLFLSHSCVAMACLTFWIPSKRTPKCFLSSVLQKSDSLHRPSSSWKCFPGFMALAGKGVIFKEGDRKCKQNHPLSYAANLKRPFLHRALLWLSGCKEVGIGAVRTSANQNIWEMLSLNFTDRPKEAF